MARNNETSIPTKVNAIVEGTVIDGTINSEGNFRIDGTVTGNINIKGRLIIGTKGKVKGKVICNDADIEGEFDGDIKINNLLNLKATSKISGDAIFQRLKVEEGAHLSCTCNIKGANPIVNNKVQNTETTMGKVSKDPENVPSAKAI